MLPDKESSYFDLTRGSTGADLDENRHKLVIVPYENFEIVVCLSEDNRFLGVAGLRIKKDFLSPEQRAANTGVFDVDEFYQE
ncbi:MAG: hypothetical protein A2V70_01510 [Planctomycetes bacterium RBG_13_63_9]|nr:MAG: hypothetical protein A2V70_01510 [Planctomycetes bacterium RBG_13_63_9]